MSNETIVYQNGNITIKQGIVFNKIGLSGVNVDQKTSSTSFCEDESQVARKVLEMVRELRKPSTRINLTNRLSNIDNAKYMAMGGW